MQKLEQKIWHAIFTHNAYSVVAQKILENDSKTTFCGLHIVAKYVITNQSYEFIQLSRHNKFCLVVFSIDNRFLRLSDGINPDDCYDYIVYSFNDEEKIYEICKYIGIDASNFTQKWKCGYPFD
jgi:hypothetical protein